jgi:hypothetical protein
MYVRLNSYVLPKRPVRYPFCWGKRGKQPNYLYRYLSQIAEQKLAWKNKKFQVITVDSRRSSANIAAPVLILSGILATIHPQPDRWIVIDLAGQIPRGFDIRSI